MDPLARCREGVSWREDPHRGVADHLWPTESCEQAAAQGAAIDDAIAAVRGLYLRCVPSAYLKDSLTTSLYLTTPYYTLLHLTALLPTLLSHYTVLPYYPRIYRDALTHTTALSTAISTSSEEGGVGEVLGSGRGKLPEVEGEAAAVGRDQGDEENGPEEEGVEREGVGEEHMRATRRQRTG